MANKYSKLENKLNDIEATLQKLEKRKKKNPFYRIVNFIKAFFVRYSKFFKIITIFFTLTISILSVFVVGLIFFSFFIELLSLYINPIGLDNLKYNILKLFGRDILKYVIYILSSSFWGKLLFFLFSFGIYMFSFDFTLSSLFSLIKKRKNYLFPDEKYINAGIILSVIFFLILSFKF